MAYGTSTKVDRMPRKFAIQKAVSNIAYETAGVAYDTKFDLLNRFDMPWNTCFLGLVMQSPSRPALSGSVVAS